MDQNGKNIIDEFKERRIRNFTGKHIHLGYPLADQTLFVATQIIRWEDDVICPRFGYETECIDAIPELKTQIVKPSKLILLDDNKSFFQTINSKDIVLVDQNVAEILADPNNPTRAELEKLDIILLSPGRIPVDPHTLSLRANYLFRYI